MCVDSYSYVLVHEICKVFFMAILHFSLFIFLLFLLLLFLTAILVCLRAFLRTICDSIKFYAQKSPLTMVICHDGIIDKLLLCWN